jgi:hypothetical protein
MEETQTKDPVVSVVNLEALFDRQKDEVKNAVNAQLSDWGNGFKAAFMVNGKGPAKEADILPKEEPKAELGESVSTTVSKVTGFEIYGVPVGGAIAGGFVAIFATELVDGYLKNQSAMVRGAVKVVGAGAIAKFLPKYLGKDLCYAVALLMAFDGFKNDIMPGLFGYATTWANKLAGTTTTAGLGYTGGPAKLADKEKPAPQTSRSPYAGTGLIQ